MGIEKEGSQAALSFRLACIAAARASLSVPCFYFTVVVSCSWSCVLSHSVPCADVVSIEKTNEFFRLLYDVRGRFAVHRIGAEEAKYKLCRVKAVEMGAKKVPYVVTHDGRTIRYPDPLVAPNDTIKLDLESGKIDDFIKFETGNLAMISGGKNTGRVGVIVSRERHQGSFDIVHVKDSAGHTFATRLGNVFVIGEGNTPLVSLPKRKGIKMSILEERALRPPKM